ncbi:RagB/SusD family nutrient uptake outer membrane protein [termite gut metagenome]|uniref:RagB/SusD family nutrient uptake outer membrane protein n=1 Tax=termite gut metagenome TaxID=433724 RepID=A0A5J4SAJ1_9ZZZZ
MNKKLYSILISCVTVIITSCSDLDVPPLNIIGDEQIFTTDQTVEIYMSRLYNDLPMWMLNGRGNALGARNTNNYTGETTGKGITELEKDLNPWWQYDFIRNVNYFLEVFPTYQSNFGNAQEKINAYMGEAYFIRAFYYFAMVKRYGGVPIVDRILKYPEMSEEELTKPRSSEEACYDFILNDLNEAIRLLPTESTARYGLSLGRVNRYIAYGMKARVALYAASIAKYGNASQYAGTQWANILGVPANRAQGYYQAAYLAADSTKYGGYELMDEGADKAANFANVFSYDADKTSKETMFARRWLTTHNINYAGNFAPYQVSTAYSSDAQPYLEAVENFEDIDGNPITINTGTDENPIYYESPLDAFANAEPRMKGSIILPMSQYVGQEIEIRKGIIVSGHTPSDALGNPEWFLTSGTIPLSDVNKYNDMYVQGKSGIGVGNGCYTGFLVRKWLDPTRTPNDWDGTGVLTPWIEMRYAEMLLIKAETAVELATYGINTYVQEGVNCVNQLRERAGSNKRFTTATLTIDKVRKERRMEFYYEDQTYWDFRRWRTAHLEQTGGYRHVIWPIYVWDTQKYYLKRTEDLRRNYPAYDQLWYYNPIPQDALNRNKLIIPNPNI